MMYVIPWVVFLVLCIFAVPIASMMDKRKARAALGAMNDPYGDDGYEGDEEVIEEEVVAEEDFPQDEIPAEEMPMGDEPIADDFSAFEEEFG